MSAPFERKEVRRFEGDTHGDAHIKLIRRILFSKNRFKFIYLINWSGIDFNWQIFIIG